MKIFNKKIADIGYYINLDSSVDRKINVESQIERFEISDLHRIPALTDSMIQSSATKSHRKVFELCREQNIESVLVLEDDFQLYENVFLGEERHTKPLIDYLDDLINEMNSVEWDVILLGFNGRKPSIPLSRQFSITFRSTGGWGYIIKKSAYEYILDNFVY
jgi:GR25 family glycosyltransferase involved in LPS biosynthesis